ncbi:MAG: response regulator [Candidatus Saccharimonadales bacterium]
MSKLLLVEDDNNLREIYEARLQAEGYTIVSAKDGEEALVVAKAESPDLIISDIMMPKISGFEMLDILRNTDNLKNVPVIMLTALGQNDDQQRADKLGADRYLVKSQVTLEDIVRVTHELLADAPAEDDSAPPAPATSAPVPPPAPPAPAPPMPDPTPPAPAPDPTPTPAPAPPMPDPTPAPSTAPEPSSDTEETTPSSDSTPSESEVEQTKTEPSTDETPASADPDLEKAKQDAEEEVRKTEQTEGQTTAQEESAVDAKIEDFVSGASEEASPPVPGATVEAESSEETTKAADGESSGEEPAPEEEPTPPALPEDPNAPKIISPTEVPTTPEPESPPSGPRSASPVVHDKVIQPLESDPKKDINTLLALEQVKEAKDKEELPGTPIIVDAKAESSEQNVPQIQPATATGPSPSSVITPGSPSISTTQSAINLPTPEEPGADLNGIAL